MKNLKPIIAKNIVRLRQSAGMTQSDLAEKLNYSDKAVSKWERAESMPDVSVLVSIAELFGVTLDYLVHAEHEDEDTEPEDVSKFKNRGFITGMCIVGVWLLATVVFVLVDIISTNERLHWLAFVYAVPISLIVWLVFNSVWFNTHRNFLIISLLMWTVLVTVYVTMIPVFGTNLWLIFVVGVPGQALIALWSKLRIKKK